MVAFLDSLAQTLVGLAADWGLLGIFVLMTIESSFIPFPSEVVMIPAGYLASQGELSLVGAILVGTAGSLVGALINYGLALKLGRPAMHQLGRKFAVSEKTMTLVEDYFERHGAFTTFIGRLIPAVRQLISIPAGLAKMDLLKFSLLTTAGAGLWVTVLTLLGYFIGSQAAESENVLRTTTLAALGVVVVLVGLYLVGSRYFKNRVAKDRAEDGAAR